MDSERQESGSEARMPRVTSYVVNGEPQETSERKLTGRQILENAGYSPPEDYRLTRNDGDKAVGLDDEEPIRQGEAFTATFKGVTPVS